MSSRPCNFCEYHRYYLKKYPNLRKVNDKGGIALYDGDTFLVWFMDLPDHCCC